jgi:Uma2 family endonuclease
MTTEEFIALPDDGVERDLIRGELRIRGQGNDDPMTVRNRLHSRAMTKITAALHNWSMSQADSGEVLCGEIGCILARNPDTTVGIDVAYFSNAILGEQSGETTLVEGAPILAVEIRSPSDTDQDVDDKVDAYLAAGTKVVWVAQPRARTITVYRPDAGTTLYNDTQTITVAPYLPGFSVPVMELF